MSGYEKNNQSPNETIPIQFNIGYQKIKLENVNLRNLNIVLFYDHCTILLLLLCYIIYYYYYGYPYS